MALVAGSLASSLTSVLDTFEGALKGNFLELFDLMESAPMSKEEQAKKLAKCVRDAFDASSWAGAITTQIGTAEVPSGAVIIAVAGDAVGTPNPVGIAVV
jgi:hypothetical protein